MRHAVIDCGSNSFRLLIADMVDKEIQEVYRAYRTVRLGAGLNAAGGTIDQETWTRCWQALNDFGNQINRFGVTEIRAVGTSALRSAANGSKFIEDVRQSLGIDIELIGGEREARYSFAGATGGRDSEPGTAVVDIGGGSTELAVAAQGGFYSRSVPVGAVRLTNVFYQDHYPSAHAREQLFHHVRELWQDDRRPVIRSLIGVAGTITTLAALHLHLRDYEPARISGTVLTPADIEAVRERIFQSTPEERRRMAGMHPPERAEIILAGTDILLATMRELEQDRITVQPTCLLEGVLILDA